MTDSGKFTSLSDLINSHLSKTEVNSSPRAKNLNGIIGSSQRDSRTNADKSTTTFKVPVLDFREPPSGSTLLGTFGSTNQEEIEESDCDDIIDLMKCLTTVPDIPSTTRKVSESSDEIDFKLSFDTNDDDITEPIADVKVPSYKKLRCVLDEYRKHVQTACRGNVKKPKCSSIGKAICTRYVETPEPYWIDERVSCVSRFNFNAKSPDDVVKDSLKRSRTNSGNYVKAS